MIRRYGRRNKRAKQMPCPRSIRNDLTLIFIVLLRFSLVSFGVFPCQFLVSFQLVLSDLLPTLPYQFTKIFEANPARLPLLGASCRRIIRDTSRGIFLFVSSLILRHISLALLAYFLVLALKEEVVRRHWTFRLFQLLPGQLLVAHDGFENACAVSEQVVDSIRFIFLRATRIGLCVNFGLLPCSTIQTSWCRAPGREENYQLAYLTGTRRPPIYYVGIPTT